MSKQPYSVRAQNDARTKLLNEIGRLKIAIRAKEIQQADESIISDLKELLANKETELTKIK